MQCCKQCMSLCALRLGHDAELHQQHESACIGRPNHHAAQQSCVLPLVIEGQGVLVGVVTDEQAQMVIHRLHQVTLLDGQDFVEGARGVEADALLMLKLFATLYLFLGQPAAVAEAELQFVAIGLGFLGTQDWAACW